MNNYTILNARLTADPKVLKFGDRDFCEVRVADNPVKKTDKKGNERKARFVTLKFWGYMAGLAGKLSKGDVIVPTGELEIESFKNNKTGEMVDKDVMTVQTFAVAKSESFYAKREEPATDDGGGSSSDDLPF